MFSVFFRDCQVMELKEEKLRARAALLLRHGSLLKLDTRADAKLWGMTHYQPPIGTKDCTTATAPKVPQDKKIKELK
eukprot:4065778-Amphidinium_carterae.1